ncbi:MAG: imidazoleglycerol-phosphate dehydratase HisB [Alphaproteobacteria bacterium]|nr:imidazoleglycerol-phosphate dehydratase HisB [Alphaproteobacteria bacterium]
MPRDNTKHRTATLSRKTKETDIRVSINLDGTGKAEVNTGIGFFDHMLEQLAKHSLIDVSVEAKGDLHIDGHHTVEDVGLTLGQALAQALGEKRGIVRYGHAYAPMDETLSRVALDLSGRPYCVWRLNFTREHIGEMEVELFKEFFHSIAQTGGITLHCENLYGTNNHHVIEATFKAFAKALRMAVSIDERAADVIPSTKGTL